MPECKYEFGGKTWVQRPLVLAQYDQISKVILGLAMPAQFDVPGVIAAFGPNIHKALAVALTPDGMHLKDKDLTAVEEEIRWSIDLPTIQQAVTDFFVLSPLLSLFENMTKMLQEAKELIETAQKLEAASKN